MLLFSLGVDGGHLGRRVALLACSLAEVAVFVGQLWGPAERREEQSDGEDDEPRGRRWPSFTSTYVTFRKRHTDPKYRTARGESVGSLVGIITPAVWTTASLSIARDH